MKSGKKENWRRRLVSICTVVLAFCVSAAAAGDETGFKPLFNGRNLEGWEGRKEFWSVEQGAVTGRSTPANPCTKNTFLVWRWGEVDDFELRLSFRIKGGNSGIQYRSREIEPFVVAGYQADIDYAGRWTGALYDERGRGVLAGRGQRTVIEPGGKRRTRQVADPGELLKYVRRGDWNDYFISARGNHLLHKINGKVTAEVIDGDPKNAERWGVLALQLHAGPPMTVQFKNIRMRRLPLKDRKKVVLIAGRASHGRGAHEFRAGILLLKHCLDRLPYTVSAAYFGGWPKDPTAFDNADTIVMYMDGGGGHEMLRDGRLELMRKLMARGVGLVMLHYAVDVPKRRAGKEMLTWIGGYYEAGYSTNPVWTARFSSLPKHPITRGVKPFTLRDEWYFHMRFRPAMEGVTPILTALPPDAVRRTKAARENAGKPEVVAWCCERPDGGRGFGFTGGHFHRNWLDDNFRKVVLNAILWTAHAKVPPQGVPSKVTPELLEKTMKVPAGR